MDNRTKYWNLLKEYKSAAVYTQKYESCAKLRDLETSYFPDFLFFESKLPLDFNEKIFIEKLNDAICPEIIVKLRGDRINGLFD